MVQSKECIPSSAHLSQTPQPPLKKKKKKNESGEKKENKQTNKKQKQKKEEEGRNRYCQEEDWNELYEKPVKKVRTFKSKNQLLLP